jgi:hypothetical protein
MKTSSSSPPNCPHLFKLFLSSEEKTLLDSLAASRGLTASDFLRQCLQNPPSLEGAGSSVAAVSTPSGALVPDSDLLAHDAEFAVSKIAVASTIHPATVRLWWKREGIHTPGILFRLEEAAKGLGVSRPSATGSKR